MFKTIAKYRYWIFLSLVFLLLRIPSLFEPYWYGDEGIYLVLGQAIRKGLVLYNQIHDNKPPTLYYLAAISQTVFGFRLLLMIFMAPTIYLFDKLAHLFLSDKLSKLATFLFLIFTSIPFFEGNIANAEIFMLLPTIAAIYLLFSSKSKSFTICIVSGLLLGFAFTIKIPVAIETLFLCLWLVIDDNFKSIKKIFFNLTNAFVLGLSFLIPIILWGIYFYFQDAIKPFLSASLLQNFGYISSWSTGTQSASVGSGGITTRLLILIIAWLLIFVLKFRKIISSDFAFILFWFSATLFGVLLSGRPYPHYLIQSLPPLTLIIIKLFNFKEIKSQIISLFSVLFLIFIVFKFNFYFYPVFKYYSNFYSYIFNFKNTSDYRHYFGSSVNKTYQISDFIKANTSSKDKIFIWGDEPYIYALSNRLPATKYTVAYHIVDFNGYNLTIDQIKINAPKFIIYYSMSNRPFPDLDNFIKKYYFISKIIDDTFIFQLR